MITIGQAHQIDEIISVTKACGRHLFENGIDQWDANYPDRESIKNDLETESLFVYQEENIILGLVVLNESQDEEYAEIDWLTDDNAKNLIVHRLAVSPEHQGKGIARKLMDHAEAYGVKQGYTSIRLDTFSQNPRNQKFYRNRGYTELGSVFLKYKKDHPYYCYELLL
ncbi:MAG: GNAT family N-acetyltransferase [Crocinitomicaceae bacterium]|nr:GNAT family N-acetyltransferase [Crocinitomicaceae bacterium]